MAKKKRSKGYSRRKGHSFERELAIEMREIGFSKARRQLEYHVDDAKGVDLQHTGPFLIQAKKYAGYVPITKINEIQPANEFQIPILVTAGTNLKPMAVLPWEHLKMLIRCFMVEEIK